ncbi:sulfur carrier protein ThiS [Flavobacterium psychrophilum]|uniref:Sulfur carrier protein ThiS n=1 Tax=Flavobacterium psychrophilum TaxID=96345 RepID=A0A7U2RBM7_FLAPS|nr:sulfur carrier protein ThiS [Flavobacterium psychrophilum]EKT3957777.1 sulfur carrier protein ThiS [Flavobacterium psychrophilum]EKT3962919.1 sulfur carrier protein ThiS [Flavobacterium psychrophilum]EKT4510523.1 sulfur carrier protein ThiS [Flavobacterium psychrophilum]EKT4516252.1 sulfur carrier protein ThiS [Flavobacterium psychrophilum]QRE04667.1 sulfur carrier protein ThiS [Flavobacterium psychrophilum]
MELKINNKTKQFAANSLTVQALLDLEIPTKQKGIALAINNIVIPKSDWNFHLVKETDDVLIISATQGG